MEKISIKRFCETQVDGGESKPFLYAVKQGNLTMGKFLVGDFDGDAEKASAAARALADKLEDEPWVSPFVRHRDLLVGKGYSTAVRLASLSLNLYNGNAFQIDMGSLLSNADEKHRAIAFELMQSYARLGENDHEFLAVCEEIKHERAMCGEPA